MKVDSLYKTCIRKGLLKENDELTLEGKELLNFLSSTKENIKIKKKKVLIYEFFRFKTCCTRWYRW
jgi:hypothetical protein